MNCGSILFRCVSFLGCVYHFVLNKFTPSKAVMRLTRKILLGVKANCQTLEGIGNAVLNRKQRNKTLPLFKSTGRSVNRTIWESSLTCNSSVRTLMLHQQTLRRVFLVVVFFSHFISRRRKEMLRT